MVITVESGKAVSQESIPTVKPKAGHTVAWEEKDLSSVTQDIIVNAIATPNTYKIFLDWNTTGLDVSSDKFNQTEQGVTYGGTYKLPTYGSITESGWKIDYWQNVQTGEPFPTSGTYTLTKNVSLKAVWAWYGGTNS